MINKFFCKIGWHDWYNFHYLLFTDDFRVGRCCKHCHFVDEPDDIDELLKKYECQKSLTRDLDLEM